MGREDKKCWVIGSPSKFNICKSTQRPYNALCEAPANCYDPEIIIVTEDNGEYTATIDSVLESDKEQRIQVQQSQKDWAEMRRERDTLLLQSDWTQMSDAELSSQKKADWESYRHNLRILPQNTSDPTKPTWPKDPS